MKKFDFAIGNPPFDEFTENNGRKQPLYHKFMDTTFQVAQCTELIHPARFLFDAGQTPKKWNEKMLNDEHFKVLSYYPDSKDVFPSLKNTIKGGVAITLKDNTKNFEPIILFTSNEFLNSILHKVISKKDSFLSDYISSRGNYRTTNQFFEEFPFAKSELGKGTGNMIASNFFEKLPNVYKESIKDEDKSNYVKMLCRINNKRKHVFIEKKYIKDNEFLNTFNVALPKSNGSGKFGEQLSSTEILYKGEGATDTFINIGKLQNYTEAKNLEKYIKTKFLRTVLGIKKVTQDNPRSTWSLVPVLDFTESSDIDWSKSIPEIDQQLYKKYGLNQEEINFIEEKVQEME